MDINKHTVPSLPATQHVLEDLSDPEIIKPNQPINLSADDETIQNAYKFDLNYKQLEADIQKQSDLSSNLDELNEKLVENIGNMKNQIQTT